MEREDRLTDLVWDSRPHTIRYRSVVAGDQILDHPLDADVLGEDPPGNRDLGAPGQQRQQRRVASVQTATGLSAPPNTTSPTILEARW